MKRKGYKNILVLAMALVLLFGNVITVSAEETGEDLADTNIFYEAQEPDENGLYHYSLFVNNWVDENNWTENYWQFTSDSPCVVYADYKETSNYKRYNYKVMRMLNGVLLSAPTNTINYSYRRSSTSGEVTYTNPHPSSHGGAFTIYVENNGVKRGDTFSTNIPVFESEEDAKNYLETMNDSTVTNRKPMSDTTLAEIDESLDFINLRFKEINGTPISHSMTWDSNENYDENTYVTIHCDIKYRPILGTLHSVSGYGWLTRFDEYPATKLGYTCLCTEPVQEYFEVNNIDWSSFNTQWVDCYYLQVLKYHPDTNTWTKSNIYYAEPTSHTTGSVSGGDAYIGKAEKNETTGEYEKENGYRVDTETGEIVSKPIEDVFGEFTDESSVSGYFEGLWSFFINGFKALASGLGQLPDMIASVVSFLPPSVITLLGLAIIVCIILRIVGR